MNLINFLKLLDTDKSNNLIKESLKCILPDKKRIHIYVVLTIITLFISWFVGFHAETVYYITEICNILLDITLTLLGISFTGFALLQATLSTDSIALFFDKSNDDGTGNLFIDSCLHMLGIIIYYFIIFVIDLILKFILVILPSNFYIIYFTNIINNIIATVLIFFIIAINLHGLLEFISIIINLFSLFIIDNVKKYLESLKK